MKITKNILAVAIIALALSSCEEGPAGIFSRVADETSTTDNMTKALEEATPKFVTYLSANSTYYSGIGTLWQKAAGASKWTQADTSGISSKTLIADSGAVAGTNLYVAFVEATSLTDLGVWATDDGSSWTQVFSAPSGQHIKSVLAAGTYFFIVTGNIRTSTTEIATYSIYRSDDLVNPLLTPNSTIGVPASVALFGTTYIFTAGGRLVVDNGAVAVIDGPAPAAISAPTTYGGVCTDSTGFVVSGRYGKLFHSVDGSVWEETAAYTDSDSDNYSLSTPTYIDDGTNQILVVGTNGKPRTSSDIPPTDGYLEFSFPSFAARSLSEDHTLITTATNFASSLDGYSVNGMPFISDTNRLFAMTDGDGLWSNTYSGSAWGGWVRE